MKRGIIFYLLVVGVFFLVACGGCGGGDDDGDDDNGGITGTPSLLVDKLGIALVPDGVELITVTARNGSGTPEGCIVACKDDSVATVVQNGSVFSVTGQDYGETSVTVTSDSGETIEIPIQVYKLDELDVGGGLILSFTSEFNWRWDDSGSGADNDGAYWHPVPPDGFHALGSLGICHYGNPSGSSYMFVVKATDDTQPLPALASPTDYELVWGDQGTGSTDDGSFWKPIPPPGYVALGLVAQSGYDKPSLDDVVCVREDLTIEGAPGKYLWSYVKLMFPDIEYFSAWQITVPDVGVHDNAYLAPGTFVAALSSTAPPVHDVMHVLKVDFPVLVAGPSQDIVPRTTSFSEPGETPPVMARTVLVPFTCVDDDLFVTLDTQLAASPFYRMERQVYFEPVNHWYNQTSLMQDNSWDYTCGITEAQSDKFWEETGISITFEAGVDVGVFSSSVSATVSRSFGHETSTSVSEFEETQVHVAANTPAGSATTVWQKYNRYIVKRHDGPKLETVGASCVYGVNSFVTTEYAGE